MVAGPLVRQSSWNFCLSDFLSSKSLLPLSVSENLMWEGTKLLRIHWSSMYFVCKCFRFSNPITKSRF